MHLGLTVMRDEDERVISTEPFFANFQYDGRTDIGREDELLGHTLDLQRKLDVIMGEGYSGERQQPLLLAVLYCVAPMISTAIVLAGITEEDAVIVDLAAATGLISSAPTPGYGKRFEDVTAADVAEWRRIFGEDFVQLQLSQEGRRRLLVSAGKRLPSPARLRVFTPIALCCRSARRAARRSGGSSSSMTSGAL